LTKYTFLKYKNQQTRDILLVQYFEFFLLDI